MAWLNRLSTKQKVLFAALLYFGIAILLLLVAGSQGKNDDFKPQNEFKLDNWIPIHLGPADLSINKAVLYLFLASGLTIFTMVFISRRMQMKPNRTQAAVEIAYDMTKNTITGGNLSGSYAKKWFPFLATLFFFITFTNIIGYLPLPTNTEHEIGIFGLSIPSFAIYAASANISFSLALTLVVWFSYHIEGVRAKGFFGYLKSFLPAGLEDMNPFGKALIFVIELLSQFMRVVSLSVRLFANILAGHLLLLFMGGGLAVLLGVAALGVLTFPLAFVFFILEVGLIATLQAFIFATLSAIYIGGAVAETH
ncbi:MAG TPA: F0F1 ATP synthase subunit A [Solirubrobacterales bacterium]|nr:F0F1 ATP synthase subunit A [Solirubrobacterales bacterium]